MLHIGTSCSMLHTKNTIDSCIEPTEEGFKNGKLCLQLTDQEASALLYDWQMNGAFDMSADHTIWRFSDAAREKIDQMSRKTIAA